MTGVAVAAVEVDTAGLLEGGAVGSFITTAVISMRRAMAMAVAIMLIGTMAPMAQAQPYVQVHDGDTLRVGQIKYRLWGVDAPELSERGGLDAKHALQEIIGADPVTCRKRGTSYDRIVAVCSTHKHFDIGMELIRRGYALDCTKISKGRYAPVETPDAAKLLPRKHYCRT